MAVTPASVDIPEVAGSVQAKIDNVSATTTEGTVLRQVGVNADPVNNNYQIVDAQGNAMTRTGRGGTAQLTQSKIDGSSSPIQLVAAQGASKIIKLYRLILTVAADTTLQIEDSTPTTFTGAMTCGAGGGLTLDFDGEPWYLSAANKALQLVLGTNCQVSGTAYFVAD